MKQNYLNLLIILIAMLITTSCQKDNDFSNNENLPSTAEWTYIDGSGFSTNGNYYVKNKAIEEGKSYVIWEKSGSLSISSEIVACNDFLVSNSAGLVARYAENGEIMWSNVNLQSFENITLNPIIYDKSTKEIYLPSVYGNKK